MTEEKRVPIPERYKEAYECFAEFVKETQNPIKYGLELSLQIIEELGAAEAERDQAKAELAEMQWKPITPDSLPKVGDEVMSIKHSDSTKLVVCGGSHDFDWWCVDMRFTHYRAINPPKPLTRIFWNED